MVVYIFSSTHAYVYNIAGSSSTTNTMATNDTSLPSAPSGTAIGDTTSRTATITTSPVTETPDQSMLLKDMLLMH